MRVERGNLQEVLLEDYDSNRVDNKYTEVVKEEEDSCEYLQITRVMQACTIRVISSVESKGLFIGLPG